MGNDAVALIIFRHKILDEGTCIDRRNNLIDCKGCFGFMYGYHKDIVVVSMNNHSKNLYVRSLVKLIRDYVFKGKIRKHYYYKHRHWDGYIVVDGLIIEPDIYGITRGYELMDIPAVVRFKDRDGKMHVIKFKTTGYALEGGWWFWADLFDVIDVEVGYDPVSRKSFICNIEIRFARYFNAVVDYVYDEGKAYFYIEPENLDGLDAAIKFINLLKEFNIFNNLEWWDR